MFWPTNRLFPLDVSVVVLAGLHKLRMLDIPMGKDAGPLSQLNSFLICSRMLRVMLKYVFHLFFVYLLMIFLSAPIAVWCFKPTFNNIAFGCLFLGERFGCGCSLCFSYPGESSSKAKTPYLQGSWKNQSYVVLFVLVYLNQSFIAITFLFLYMSNCFFCV
jgi:hypothetical protein